MFPVDLFVGNRLVGYARSRFTLFMWGDSVSRDVSDLLLLKDGAQALMTAIRTRTR